mgnify:CR=1 FL=1
MAGYAGGKCLTEILSFDRYDANGNRTKSSLGETEAVYVYNGVEQLTSEMGECP